MTQGREICLSTTEMREAVFALAEEFQILGLERESRVAILSENRPEWHLVEFAAHLAGLIVVPIYPNLPTEQIRYLLGHSGASVLIVSGKQKWDLVAPIFPDLPQLRWVYSMDAWPRQERTVTPLASITSRPVCPDSETELRLRARRIDPDSVATIIYTSGTTGRPKGAMLTHRNLLWNVEQSLARLGDLRMQQSLSILPLAHIFERHLCYAYWLRGLNLAYGEPADALALLRRYRPQVLGAVPRILEKIHESAEQRIAGLPGFLQRWLRVPRIADLLVYRKLRAKLGGRLRLVISGGAALRKKTGEFLTAAGVPVAEGYGMTESGPVIAFQAPGAAKLGTVGPPLEGVEIKIASDGELLTRGPHVMKGYFQEPLATAEVLHHGWLHTGDLVSQDTDGCLTIRGRKKELIVTSYGKNVAHQPIEERLAARELIRFAMVIGDGRPYLTALLVPHTALLRERARQAGVESLDFDDLLRTPWARKQFEAEILRAQWDAADFERVRRFAFLPESIVENPEFFTPTLKLRRKTLEARYAAMIETLYEPESKPATSESSGAALSAAR
jgi:long-chain acyl-CoA synthetase